MELPRGTVRVEDAMTEEGAHKPKKPLSYETVRRHFGKRRWTGANLSQTSQSRLLRSTVMTKREGANDQFSCNWNMHSHHPGTRSKVNGKKGGGRRTNLDVSRFSGKDLRFTQGSVSSVPAKSEMT